MVRWCLPLLAIATAASAAPEQGLVVSGRPARLGRAVDTADRPAFQSLAAEGWRALWDHDTGVPAWVFGTYVATPGAVADPAIAERAARAFLAAHLAVLAPGAAASDFVLIANHLDAGKRTVGFRQTWHGMPVVGAEIGFVLANDRLFAIGSRALPLVTAPAPGARAEAEQRRRAETWVAAATGVTARTRAAGGRVVLPIVRGPGDIEYRIADMLDVESVGAAGRWDVYVDPSGAPIARASRLRFASGTLTYDASVRYPAGGRMSYPAPTVQLTADGAPTTTAADGTFAWGSATAATIVTALTGTYVAVGNAAGATASSTLTAQPGGSVVWSLATDERGDAQVASYIYGNLAKARARLINPGLAWIDQQLSISVNEAGSCNAFSTGDDLHFFFAAGGCENTARISDVVFHEFGHSLHNNSVIPGMGAFETQLTEGLADFNAANITEDSGIGRGIMFTDAPLREIDPPGFEPSWPRDISSDPHTTGLIISGALWDLRKAVIAELGHDAGVAVTENVFKGVMQRAPDIPSTYMAALIADDDNGNLGDGTPHECAIQRAFDRHGLSPGVDHTKVDPPVASGLALAIAVHPAADPCAISVQSVEISWHVGTGATATFALVGQGTSWTGSFPDQPPGTVISYHATVMLDDGTSLLFPDNTADPEYTLFVGDTAPIWCERFETDPHWTAMSTTFPEWQVATPQGLGGDPAAAHTGVKALGTDLIDDGTYFANETTTITSPAIDVSAFQSVRLQYWRWLTVDDGKTDQAGLDLVDPATNIATPLWANAMSLGAHVDKEWRFQDFDLAGHIASDSVQLRWSLITDASRELGGWTIDDVCLVTMDAQALCGNGVIDPGEECDDHNTTPDDGCSATCTLEHHRLEAGGGCCSASGGPGGSVLLALGVLGLGRRRRARARPRRIDDTGRRRRAV